MRGMSAKVVGLGVVALAASFLVLGASVYRALNVEPLPEAAAPLVLDVVGSGEVGGAEPPARAADEVRAGLGDRPTTTLPSPREPGTPSEVMSRAIQNDLFLPERTQPAERYRLPSEIVVVEEPEERERLRFPDLRVHGTAQLGDGGLAVIRLEDRDEDDALPPRVLSLGESIAGYSLLSVTADNATLIGPAGTLVLPVLPLPRVEPPRERNSRNADREVAERTSAQIQQLIQQLGGRGVTGARGGRGGQAGGQAGRGGRGGRGGGESL